MARYGCVCCAIPQKMIRHLADKSEPPHRALLESQIHHSATLRTERATHAVSAPPDRKGSHVLHRQLYDAQGRTLLPGKLLRDEDDPPAREKEADLAYENIGIAMQFYRSVLGRDSVDGRGRRVDVSVHYGMRFANAMWTGEQMIVGDGDGVHVTGLAHSLGIIAHEYSHGVTQHLVRGGLGVVQEPGRPPALKGEAGALNESFSDVFASMIKQWHAGQDTRQADWLVGEDILARHAGHAVRSLKEPGKRAVTWAEDDQISDYRAWHPDVDAHTGSGIPNHAFYVAATRLGGRSWEQLAAIWLKAFGRLTKNAGFREAAKATLDVAAALHGKRSAPCAAIEAGWEKVNVLA